MSATQHISKAKQTGKTGSPLHKTGSEGASHVKGISSAANTPLNAFYSSGPIFGLGNPVQKKLTIGKPNDKYEQEADRVADLVMRMPEPKRSLVNGHSSLVQRKSTCPECTEEEPIQTKPLAHQITPLVQRQVEPEEEEEKIEPGEAVQGKFIQKQEEEKEEEELTPPVQEMAIQRQDEEEEKEDETVNLQPKGNTGSSPKVTPTIASGIRSLKGGGQPLPMPVRNYFEPRFGTDFSQVRLHTDSKAAETAKSINAKVFTTGRDVAFGSGKYSPNTNMGRRLLAHELTHVLQQREVDRHSNYMPYLQREIKGDTSIQSNRSFSVPPPRSLNESFNYNDLSNIELDREIQLIRLWISNHPDDLKNLALRNNLGALENELEDRNIQTSQVEPGNVALPTISGNDKRDFHKLMKVVQSIVPSKLSTGLFSVDIGEHQIITITQDQANELIATSKKAIKETLRKIRMKAEDANSRYNYQKKIDEEHWIVSPIVKFFGGVKDPGLGLFFKVLEARQSAALAEDAMELNNFTAAAEFLAKSEIAAIKAYRMWRAYHEGIISSSESIISTLEFTRDASFITLGVLAVIATGGAAAGGAGATTTLFGAKVGTVTAATLISTGAPIVATLGEAGVKMALGDEVDWTRVGVDIAVSIILARFGGKLSQGLYQKIIGSRTAQSIGKAAFGRIMTSVIMHEGSTAFTTTVDAVYRKFKGQNVTWEQFTDELIQQMTDPKGLFIAVASGAIETYADVKFGGGTQKSRQTKKKGKVEPRAKEDKQENIPYKNKSYKELEKRADEGDIEAVNELITRRNQRFKEPRPPTEELEKMTYSELDKLAKDNKWAYEEWFARKLKLEKRLIDFRKKQSLKEVIGEKGKLVGPKGYKTGGTLAVAETDIPGLENSFYEGASPWGGGKRVKKGMVESEFSYSNEDLTMSMGHAEERVFVKFSKEVDPLLNSGELTPKQLEGKTLRVHVEQDPCEKCKAGLGNSNTEGPIAKFVRKYKGLRVEITDAYTGEILISKFDRTTGKIITEHRGIKKW